MKPRKHHEVIKQWADGADVYMRKDAGEKWRYTADPAFVEDYEYCVGPVREYPKSGMLLYEYEQALRQERIKDNVSAGAAIAIANYALCHAIDHGQVVTREEFDRAIGDRKARDREVAEAMREACYSAALRQHSAASASEIRQLVTEVVLCRVKP